MTVESDGVLREPAEVQPPSVAVPCGLGNWGPEWADPGACHYCPKIGVPVKPEPFGGHDACQECWEAICYGE